MPNLSFLAPAYAGLDPAWRSALSEVWHSAKLAKLDQALSQRHAAGAEIYPQRDQLFHALNLTPPDQVKVVILGQDPYHEPGQANGLAFSVNPGVKLPPSLRNNFTEVHTDLGLPQPSGGDLTPWAERGVLLLNRVLTVRPGAPGSHRGKGWEQVTQQAIEALVARGGPLVAILWGRNAQSLAPLLTNATIIASPHPSPLSASRGFFGSHPFSRANQALVSMGAEPVDWSLPSAQADRPDPHSAVASSR